jgi:hypothetical protein
VKHLQKETKWLSEVWSDLFNGMGEVCGQCDEVVLEVSIPQGPLELGWLFTFVVNCDLS